MKRFLKTVILVGLSGVCLGWMYVALGHSFTLKEAILSAPEATSIAKDASSATKAAITDVMTWDICLSASLLWMFTTAACGSFIQATCWHYLETQHKRPVPRLLRMMVTFVIAMLLGAALLECVFHKSLTTLWAASAFSGLGLILGLKDMLTDIFSGVLLNLDQPFRIHDRIKISINAGSVMEGHVVDIDWRSTKLRTLSGDLVVIPNSIVTGSAVTNLIKGSRPECCEFKLHIDPEAPVEMVRKMILIAAGNSPVVMKNPAPVALVNDLHDWCVEYLIQFHYESSTTSIAVARDMVITAVLDQMRRNRIVMASQKHEILMQQRSAPSSNSWE